MRYFFAILVKMYSYYVVVFIAFFACSFTSFAQDDSNFRNTHLSKGEEGKLVRVIDGDSFILQTPNNAQLRVNLASIALPHDTKAISEEAKSYLQTLLEGENIYLYYLGDKRDIYGRALAHIWVQDIWVQKAMLEKGLAYVYTYPHMLIQNARENKEKKNLPWAQNLPRYTDRLYQAEQTSRIVGLGLWKNKERKEDADENELHTFHAILPAHPEALKPYYHSTQIVEGRIYAVADVKGIVYLNFGKNYKTDFTIAINKSARAYFTYMGYNPLDLAGARIRVRGWLEPSQNGPVIWISDPLRLEVLD